MDARGDYFLREAVFFYMDGHIGDEKEDKPRSQNNRLRELSIAEL